MWLRQSTASQEILLGRFVDSTDGDTEETGLTIANTDIKLWVEGATTLASKNSGGATHIANGMYYAVLDATDTATLGKLEVHVHVSGALAVKREFMVMPAMIYDSVVLGTDRLDTNVTHMNDVSASAVTTIKAVQGLAVDGVITTLTNLPAITANWLTATGIASDAITAAKIANDAITDAKVASDVTIASVTGAVGSVTGNVGGNVTGSVGSVVGAVGSVTGNVGGNVVGSVGSVSGAVGSVTGNVGGNVTGSVGSVASGGITSSSFAAGAITIAAAKELYTTIICYGGHR